MQQLGWNLFPLTVTTGHPSKVSLQATQNPEGGLGEEWEVVVDEEELVVKEEDPS